ncbi:MAG: hypothetical protein Q7R59_01675 [bacterium]|nr:hypothetical protein [bacterium]
MDFTDHGIEHICDRTSMRPEDVLSVVSDGASVDLGLSSNGYRYFLFYSSPDNCTKIAIVSGDRTCLVSIWENNYRLPEDVKKATRGRDYRARKKLRAYVFSRLKKTPKPA